MTTGQSCSTSGRQSCTAEHGFGPRV